MTPNPLSYQDIAAWVSLTRNQLRPWEVRAIKALDSAYLEEVSKK